MTAPTTISNPSRSEIMRAVNSKDTTPEMIVRRLFQGLGYRYLLHGKDLLGKPYLVFAGPRKVIFVNGCFWHGYVCRRGAQQPKDNAEYWKAKIGRNVERDADKLIALAGAG